jgi:hypothetical protein
MDIQHEATYKLGKYKIIEGVGGGLWWESHHGLSDCQTGRCFIEGNILIVGPVESEKSGFLKREFMEHIDRLPAWSKTKYFCLSRSICKCETGARMSLISETERPMDVTLNSIRNRATDKMDDSRKIAIEEIDYRKHFSALKIKMGGGWKLVKQWINQIQRSR